MQYSLKEYKKVGKNHEITLRCEESSILDFIFGKKDEERTFIGSCTVWYEQPNWERAGTDMEKILSCFHAKITHEEYIKELKNEDSKVG